MSVRQLLAIMDCDRANELDPKYTKVYVNRGESYLRLGNPAKKTKNLKNFRRVRFSGGTGLAKGKKSFRGKGKPNP
jgi:hypothetical protein